MITTVMETVVNVVGNPVTCLFLFIKIYFCLVPSYFVQHIFCFHYEFHQGSVILEKTGSGILGTYRLLQPLGMSMLLTTYIRRQRAFETHYESLRY